MTKRKNLAYKKHFKNSHRLFAVGLATALLILLSVSIYVNNTPAQGSMVVASANEKLDSNSNTTGIEIRPNPRISEQLFQCDVFYAYVGKGNSTNASSDLWGNTEYPLSQYPSAIYLNFTRLPNATSGSCDVKFEVYLFEITTDKNTREKYIWLEGTNINPSFSDFNKVQMAAAHVDDLIDRRTITGQGGHFLFNWTVETSIAGGCIGSIGRYTSTPSVQGLWSAGKPETLSVNIRLLGWITINDNTVSSTANTAFGNVLEIQLQNFGDGFIHNKIVPLDQLPQMDLFSPTVPIS